MAFLLARPAFARLIAWEELAGAQRLRAADRRSDALEQAFAAVRRRRRRRFDVDQAVLLWVGLTYVPVAQRHTLGRDMNDAAARRRHVRFAARQMMAFLS
jgi:hypothetical protein